MTENTSRATARTAEDDAAEITETISDHLHHPAAPPADATPGAPEEATAVKQPGDGEDKETAAVEEDDDYDVPMARSCPEWCLDPHYENEPHFGPCADVKVHGVKGTPLLVSIDCDHNGEDIVALGMKTPGWRIHVTEPVIFTLDQAAQIRDVLDEFLTLTNHPAAKAS
ncbi:hypothetical protein LO762_28730 [Actinocorallia sp. API 0066]|uniref:hypothetical protein n=1 Tax=Actinocorallia sp. API 0066 TaxID=2896846 RepID=UPI001E3DE9D6|nr:hypothetical protein [Actinocorallia sp. API 0066]MCD0453137.1 hypothetical protein [Actinocorallia sp. API 0066]